MNENMTVSQLYDNWIDRRKIVIGYGSGSTYKFYFDNYLLRRFGDREVNLIPKGEYAAFVSALRNIKGTRGQELSTAALKQIVRAFRMMFEFGKNEYGLTDPAEKAKIAHKDNTDSSVFTDEEIDRLENAATLYDIHHISILLCLHTGITRGEVCSLKWKNIDIDNSSLKIRRYYDGADNGGRKLNRDVPIPDRLVDQLSIIKSAKQAEDYLMTGSGSPMDVSVFVEMLLHEALESFSICTVYAQLCTPLLQVLPYLIWKVLLLPCFRVYPYKVELTLSSHHRNFYI